MCFRRFSGQQEDSLAFVSCPEAKVQPSYSPTKPDTGHCQPADFKGLSGFAIVSCYSRIAAVGSLVPGSSIDNSMPALSCSYASEAPAESLAG